MKIALLLTIGLLTGATHAGETTSSSRANFVLKYAGPLDALFGDLNDIRISSATPAGNQHLTALGNVSPLLQNNLKLFDQMTSALDTRSTESGALTKLFQRYVGIKDTFGSLFIQVYVKQTQKIVPENACDQADTMISLLVLDQKDQVTHAATIYASNCESDRSLPTVRQLLATPADQVLSSLVDLEKASAARMPGRAFRE